MYNIVLKKKTETIKLAEYDFDSDHTGYYDNPLLKGKDKDIKGYKINYGVALEVRKPGNGIEELNYLIQQNHLNLMLI